jgi:hypothetical protein
MKLCVHGEGHRWWPICGGVYVVRAVSVRHAPRHASWKNGRTNVRALAPVARREPATVPAEPRRRRAPAQLRLVVGGGKDTQASGG